MRPHHIISPRDDDVLALPRGLSELPIEVVTILRAKALGVRPTKRAAVVVSMRDDGISILQWVAHYRALGFDGIFIYSNDNIDGSEALLAVLAEAGIITYIESQTSGAVPPQRKAFAHSLRVLDALRDYEWVLYADSDEFLTLAPRYENDINNVLAHVGEAYPEERPAAICYHWRWFISDFVYERTDGLLLKRFEHSKTHRSLKSLVQLRKVASMHMLHVPELLYPGFFVDSELGRIDGDGDTERTWAYIRGCTPNYGGGELRHYWTKSFQEFAIKKRRGDMLDLDQNPYQRDFLRFFDQNDISANAEHAPPDPQLVQAVEREISALRMIPGVTELDRKLNDSFLDLLEPFGGDRGLRALYEETAKGVKR